MGGDSVPVGTTTKKCTGGQWTNVLWYVGFLWTTKYEVDIGSGNTAKYRKYGVAILPYWEGSFTGATIFRWYPWNFYIRVDIKLAKDVTATMRRVL